MVVTFKWCVADAQRCWSEAVAFVEQVYNKEKKTQIVAGDVAKALGYVGKLTKADVGRLKKQIESREEAFDDENAE
jgi:hypothetical protein